MLIRVQHMEPGLHKNTRGLGVILTNEIEMGPGHYIVGQWLGKLKERLDAPNLCRVDPIQRSMWRGLNALDSGYKSLSKRWGEPWTYWMIVNGLQVCRIIPHLAQAELALLASEMEVPPPAFDGVSHGIDGTAFELFDPHSGPGDDAAFIHMHALSAVETHYNNIMKNAETVETYLERCARKIERFGSATDFWKDARGGVEPCSIEKLIDATFAAAGGG